MKTHTTSIEIVPRGERSLFNSVASSPGEGARVVNLREHEGTLAVVGNPTAVGAVPASSRLLLELTDGRMVWQTGDRVRVDGTHVFTLGADETLLHADECGGLLIITTTMGMTALSETTGTWQELRNADVVPSVTVSESNRSTTTATIAAMTFATPYTRWTTPLSATDTEVINDRLQQTWRDLENTARRDGRHCGLILARYGVRLHDDTYLWLSEPVVLSDVATANAARESVADVTHTSSEFTGLEALAMSIITYDVTATITRGVGRAWWSLVKSIDLMVSDELSLVNTYQPASLRAVTDSSSGSRAYRLVARLADESQTSTVATLRLSDTYTVIARCTDPTGNAGFTTLSTGEKVKPSVTINMATILTDVPLVDSLTHNGRYYALTGNGTLAMSATGNPLVCAYSRQVTGAEAMALLPVTRPLFWGSAGRYVVYVFTGDGIYAVPQSSSGAPGEPRLVYRTVIKRGVHPVEGELGIYYVTAGNVLRHAGGNTVITLMRGCDAVELAMCDTTGELWLRGSDGSITVIGESRLRSQRTLRLSQLYQRVARVLGITAGGDVLDLSIEESVDDVEVCYESHAVALNGGMSEVERVTWTPDSDNPVCLELTLWGDRGVSCHGAVLVRVHINGQIKAPITVLPVSAPVSVVRIGMCGTAPTGARLSSAWVVSRAIRS